jgi:hypothetical protein
MDEDKREDFFQIKKVKTVPSEISERPERLYWAFQISEGKVENST